MSITAEQVTISRPRFFQLFQQVSAAMLLSLIVPEHWQLLSCGIVFFQPMTVYSSRLPSQEDLSREIMEAGVVFVFYNSLTNALYIVLSPLSFRVRPRYL